MLYWAGMLAKQGVRTMFCDWEMDDEDHKARAVSLFGDHIPEILYVKCKRALTYEIDRLARLKHEHKVGFAFFDSVGFAAPGKPEDAQTALQYMMAIRSLEIGTMHAAHCAGASESREHRPFGSVFWHNAVRQTWFAKAEETGASADNSRTVALINRKYSVTAAHAARAFRFEFEPHLTRIVKTDPALVESAVKNIPLSQRIRSVVISGPKTFAEIADALDEKENSIRKSVSRGTRTFKVVEGFNGAQRVALLELRAAS